MTAQDQGPARPAPSSPLAAHLAPLMRVPRWRSLGHCHVPAAFAAAAAEEAALATGSAFADGSWHRSYLVSGPSAFDVVDRLTTTRIEGLGIARSTRAVLCDDAGYLIDLCTIYRFDRDVFQIVSDAPLGYWLCEGAEGFDVGVEETSGGLACIYLCGPRAPAILSRLGYAEAERLPLGALDLFEDGQLSLHVCRRGPAGGEDGFELWFTAEAAGGVIRRLLALRETAALTPVGADALEGARILAGMPRAFQDFHPAHLAAAGERLTGPRSVGLGALVDHEKGPFCGRAALERRARAPVPLGVRLFVEGDGLRPGAPLHHGLAQLGTLTSVHSSASHAGTLALARLDGPLPGGAAPALEVRPAHGEARRVRWLGPMGDGLAGASAARGFGRG
ncbi:MAG: hypothetical protein HXY25_09515 [Alphaproteobacteria bacterium]|nr:hypothetical protein [Alphaproteobacteria bacterium]